MCPNLEKVPPRNFFLIHFAPATASILDVEWFAFCKLDIILSDVCKLCHEVSLLILLSQIPQSFGQMQNTCTSPGWIRAM